MLFLSFVMTAHGQQTRELTAEKHNEYGLVYTLPRTSLRIDVDVRRVVKKAGPFYQYAKKYIGTDNVVKADREIWSITDVRVTPIGLSDASRRFLMQLKANSPVTMTVADNNMLLAINAPATIDTNIEDSDTELVVVKEGSDVEEFLQYVGEDYLASTSTAKRAQNLSEQLVEIRDNRNALTRGTADNMPSDGRQLELMLDNMQRQERAITAAFAGSEEVSEQTVSYYFTPSEDGKTVLFRMSDFAGPVEADNYAGSPVELVVNVTERGELPVDAKGEVKKLPKDAVIYCIPGRASVTLRHENRTLYSNPNMYFSQFGVDFGLDPTVFTDKKDPAYVLFDSTTGAVVKKGSVNTLKSTATRSATNVNVVTEDADDNYSSAFE